MLQRSVVVSQWQRALKYDPGMGVLAPGLCAQIAHYLLRPVCSPANKHSQAALQRVAVEICPSELLFFPFSVNKMSVPLIPEQGVVVHLKM